VLIVDMGLEILNIDISSARKALFIHPFHLSRPGMLWMRAVEAAL
jgi:hypothetical protein